MRQSEDRQGPRRQYVRLRTLAILATLIFALAMSGTLLLFQARSEEAVRDGILAQARAHALEFNAVRAYVQGYSGVYVPASTDTSVSPHLTGVSGVLPEIIAPNGKRLILQNAPVVARQISKVLENQSDSSVQVSLSAASPLNPTNEPDAFAKAAIARFNRGAKESFTFQSVDGSHEFYYATGVPMAEKCVRCHPTWAASNSGNAGALIVRLDVTDQLAYLTTSRIWTGIAILGIVLISALTVHTLGVKVLVPMYRAQQQLYDLANRDSLTGLDVRRVGMETLSQEVARAKREEQCLACCMLDLDDFKQVNDELGHTLGDEVLAAVGEAIRGCLRPYDHAARVGGEEFLLLLPGVCAQEADDVVERIRTAVATASQAIEGLNRIITCSAGIAVLDPPSKESAHELFIRADQALLAAKRAGKNRGLVSTDGLLRSASVLRPNCAPSHMEPDAL